LPGAKMSEFDWVFLRSMPSQLAESVKYLMSLKAHQMRFTLEEIKREMCQYTPKPLGIFGSGYICYYLKQISGEIGYVIASTLEESLQNPKKLIFMSVSQTFEISDPNIIVGNIPVKAYLEKWLADYDDLIEECDKQSEKETRVEALEKEVEVLKKALADTLDLLQSIARTR